MAWEAQRIDGDADDPERRHGRALEARSVRDVVAEHQAAEQEVAAQDAAEQDVAAQDVAGAVDGTTTATPSGDPGDPARTAKALALCVAEILTGAREVDSIARWITEDVHRHLQQRAATAARARSASRHRGSRPSIHVGSAVVSRPVDGVAEVSVVVHTRSHARAVALRLEVRAGRWRATAIGML